uniref:Uncharacterized protein n=1 Tax=Trichuris muris TaxID=70415 RepID=A0A5S6Q7I4_TRIMR
MYPEIATSFMARLARCQWLVARYGLTIRLPEKSKKEKKKKKSGQRHAHFRRQRPVRRNLFCPTNSLGSRRDGEKDRQLRPETSFIFKDDVSSWRIVKHHREHS